MRIASSGTPANVITISGSGDGSNSDPGDSYTCPEFPNNPDTIYPSIPTEGVWVQGTEPNTFCRKSLGDPGGDCTGCEDCQGNCLP